MKVVITLIIVLFLATSCTPKGRLRRLLRNHPELIKIEYREKVVIDTVIIQGNRVDSTFSEKVGDSAIIDVPSPDSPGKLLAEVRIKRISKDSIRASVQAFPDTVIKKVRVPYESQVVKVRTEEYWYEKVWHWMIEFFITVGIVVIIGLIMRFIWHRQKWL